MCILCIRSFLCPYAIHAYACTQLLAEERSAYDAATKAKAATTACTSVDLDMRIKIVDGDAVIADTEAQVGMLLHRARRSLRERLAEVVS